MTHLGLAERGHALEAAVVVDRHDTGDDRRIDAVLPAVLDELEEDVRVVEELRHNDLPSGVHLKGNKRELVRSGQALRQEHGSEVGSKFKVYFQSKLDVYVVPVLLEKKLSRPST